MDETNKAQQPNHLNSHETKQVKDPVTADKSNLGIVMETQKQDPPFLRSFTPTRRQSLLENSLSLSGALTQQYIFTECLSGFMEKNQRKRSFKQIEQKIQSLDQKVTKLQKIQNKIVSSRRIRRKSTQIEKVHKCPNKQCGKYYGTETALKKHLKNKHSHKFSSSKIQEKQQKQ